MRLLEKVVNLGGHIQQFRGWTSYRKSDLLNQMGNLGEPFLPILGGHPAYNKYSTPMGTKESIDQQSAR